MDNEKIIEKIAGKKSPPEWGNDHLSKFIEMAWHNVFASFVNFKGFYIRLEKIDAAFRSAIENLTNTRDWFPGFFLLRAHSAYLGAVRLALSAQVGEAYMVLRGCLENALYGFFFWKNPQKSRLWYERHDSIMKKKEGRREFQIKTMLQTLKKEDPKEGKIAEQLYEWCIDYGAHPNERSISGVMDKIEESGNIDFKINYLLGGKLPARACLKTTGQIGVSALMIFQLIFRTRFELIGLSNDLKQLSKGL